MPRRSPTDSTWCFPPVLRSILSAIANPLRALTRVRDAGATIASCSVGARSVEHYCEQLEELHRIALAEGFSFTTS